MEVHRLFKKDVPVSVEEDPYLCPEQSCFHYTPTEGQRSLPKYAMLFSTQEEVF